MEEQLISFETAKLAKEKGFPQRNDDNDEHSGFACKKCWVMDIDGAKDVWVNSNAMAAWACPTQSLLQKWLREKHNIYVTPMESYSFDKSLEFVCTVNGTLVNHGEQDKPINRFYTYEEALEKGLYEALKLI